MNIIGIIMIAVIGFFFVWSLAAAADRKPPKPLVEYTYTDLMSANKILMDLASIIYKENDYTWTPAGNLLVSAAAKVFVRAKYALTGKNDKWED